MIWRVFELLIFLSAIQYLVGEATILERLRSRLPLLVQELLACPSCSGFWLGLLLGGAVQIGPWTDGTWAGAFLTGLAGVALTPIGRGLMALGWAVSQGGGHNAHDHDHDHDHDHGSNGSAREVAR